MIIRFVFSFVILATVERAAASTTESTLSQATECLLLRMIEVYFFFLLQKQFAFKIFAHLRDSYISNPIYINCPIRMNIFEL